MIDSFWELLLYTVCIYGAGVTLGYILWAPVTAFKLGFLDGMTFGPAVRFVQKCFTRSKQ
jgi:hypothetical protein